MWDTILHFQNADIRPETEVRARGRRQGQDRFSVIVDGWVISMPSYAVPHSVDAQNRSTKRSRPS